MHVSVPSSAYDQLSDVELDELVLGYPAIGDCCIGSAVMGIRRCTCWEPVYDLTQDVGLITEAIPEARAEMCHDCAYRPDSPEHANEHTAEMIDSLPDAGTPFFCHQGIRCIVAWRHPCGLELPSGSGAYDPPIMTLRGARIPFRADGQPGLVCAGWATRHARSAEDA
jgi:hypothetical protein